MKKLFLNNKSNPWFWAFLVIAVALFFVMPMLSHSAGNSGDEDSFQIPQGENILNYYASHKQDTTCMTFENLKYYGCSFDVVTAWWNRTFHVDDIARTRHTANALCGWLVVLFVGLIAYRIGGWRAGVIAMVLMFFSPRFLGHSFNNPKDIPFAAGVTMAIYYMLMFFRQAPKPKWSTMMMLAISIAFAISIRIGGLIIIGYMGMWGLLWVCFRSVLQQPATTAKGGKRTFAIDWNGTLVTILWAAAICIVGFLCSLILWPYAAQKPIANSIESYHAMSQFAIAIRQIYEGQMVWSDALPWYYTPKFIFTTIPIAVIIGWVLYSFTGAWRAAKPCHDNAEEPLTEKQKGTAFYDNRLESIMLYFMFIFPVLWIVYTKANVYGGWRHSLFAYPPMVATAALGFNGLVNLFQKPQAARWHKPAAIVATLLPLLLLVHPIKHTLANHPYEYVYFNEFVGGAKNAFAQYEMDYYYHSIREATEWVKDNATPSPLQSSDKITVGSWHINSTRYFLRHDTAQYQTRFVRWYSRGDYDWDYAVFPLTGIDPAYLTSSLVFPPKNMVHHIDVDGVPIAVVLKRDDKNDYYGSELKKKGMIDSALIHFHRALQVNPYNESALINMAEIYLMKTQPDSVLWACDRFREFEPDNDNANYFAAYAYMQKRDVAQAITLCENILKHNFKYGSAYQLLVNLYAQQGNLQAAERVILRAIDVDQMSNPLMQAFMQIKQNQGFDQRMATVSLYRAMVKSYEKRGKKREAAMYEDMLNQM